MRQLKAKGKTSKGMQFAMQYIIYKLLRIK